MVQKVNTYDVKNLAPYWGSFTATCTGAGATSTVTLHRLAGTLTTASLTTAAGATHTITWTNSHIKVGDVIFLQILGGTDTQANWTTKVTATAGTGTIVLQNAGAAAANGTTVVAFFIAKTL